jgi:membrane protein implicated in regulation of membrane protease activity
MNSGPSTNGAAPPPTGSSLPAFLFIAFVACGVGGVLLVFAPGWLLVFGVLVISVALQYVIWGRWLHRAIEAEDAADAELHQDRSQRTPPSHIDRGSGPNP